MYKATKLLSFRPDADIAAKVFITQGATATQNASTVKTAVDGTAPIMGISGRLATDQSEGDVCEAYCNEGDLVELKLGGTVSAGAYLMPDASGYGVTATDGNYFGAQAREDGVSGDVITVMITKGYLETT